MILTDIRIDGFGKFHLHDITNIHSKLTIFLGSNETGKSTIINFIKRVLFGFPDKRNNVNLYPAMDGGNHGGRIVVSHQSGSYMIERYSDDKNSFKIILPNGNIGSVQDFYQLTGNINREVFDNVFAFGLDELQNFETLNSESIKDQLYSAGKGIGNFSLKDFQKEIDKKAGDIYKDKGSQPEINELFREISELTSKINEIGKDSTRFEELTREFEKTNLEIENIDHEKKQTLLSNNHLSNVLHAWGDYQKLLDSQEKLSKLPNIDSFLDDGSIILNNYLEKQKTIEQSLMEKKEKLEKIQLQKLTLTFDEKLILNKEQINDLQKRQQQYIQADIDLPLIRAQYQTEKEGLDGFLAEIGPGWTQEKLNQIDTSIPTKDKVRKFDNRLQELNQHIKQAETEIAQLENEKRNQIESKNELELANQKINLQPNDKEGLLEKRNSFNHLKANQVTLKELDAELQTIQNQEKTHYLIKSTQSPRNKMINLTPYSILFLLLSFFGLGFSLYQKNYPIAFLMGLFFVLSQLMLFLTNKQNKKNTLSSREKGIPENLYKLDPEKKKSILDSIQNLNDEITRHVQICNLSNCPTLLKIDTLDQLIQESLIALDKKENLLEQIGFLIGKIEKLDIEIQKKGHEKESWFEKKNLKIEEWKSFLTLNNLEEMLSPDAVIDIFTTLKTAIEMKKATEKSLGRIQLMDECIQDFKKDYSTLNLALARKGNQPLLIADLENMYQELDESIKNKEKLKSILTEEDNLNIERNRSLEEQAKNERGIKDLLSRGFTDSIDQFRENEKVFKNRIELAKEITISEKNIKKFCGDAKSYDTFLMDLETTSFDSLKEQEIDFTQKLESIDSELNQLRNKQGRISQEIEQIEKREEGTILRIEKSVKIEQGNQKAREWSTLILSRAMMKKAMEKYEREKQPDVIKESQIFFSLMTLGRYPYIFAPMNESKINIVEKNGNQKEVRELSKGTAEQLYLALRFGFIREFSKRSEPLPIIFDDVFVNFDPMRFSASCETVKELSNTHQLLYFTCHPDSANHMKKVIPDSDLIELGAG